MTRSSDQSKLKQLARRAVLHPHPEKVTEPLFQDDPFFDPHDLVQVKYELLRNVQVDGRSINRATSSFGLSRPTYYETRAAFERAGMLGLLPEKKGPRRAHKLSEEVMSFVAERLEREPTLTPQVLAELIAERCGVTVHPRSVVRALVQREKKNR